MTLLMHSNIFKTFSIQQTSPPKKQIHLNVFSMTTVGLEITDVLINLLILEF